MSHRLAISGVAVMFAILLGSAAMAVERRPVVEGAWSKPVADARGFSLRGRLCIEEEVVAEERREFAVYVELQEASDFVGRSLRLYCQFNRYDYKDKTGLHCQLLDAKGKPIASQPPPFGGGIPSSIWVVLPTDGTIRLRSTPFGMHRPGSMVICSALHDYWTIANDDPAEYTLTGRFTIDPPQEKDEIALPEHIWRGTIESPPLKIRRAK